MRVPEKGRSVVEARGLGLTFETSDGPVHALSDVSLDIGKGEFVSFIGPSGCGKTTFLRVIADLEKPTTGDISVNACTGPSLVWNVRPRFLASTTDAPTLAVASFTVISTARLCPA